MEEHFIELEEYKEGCFREKRPKWWQRKKKGQRVESETIPPAIASVYALFNVSSYDCLITIATVGIITRTIMLAIYVLTSHRIEYDLKITVWGLLSRGFWIYIDAGLIQTWNKYVRARMIALGAKSLSSQTTVTLVKIAAWTIAGSTLALAVVERHLSSFFMLSKIMVMGGLLVNLLLVVYRIMRVQKVLDSGDFLPHAMSEMLSQFFTRQGDE